MQAEQADGQLGVGVRRRRRLPALLAAEERRALSAPFLSFLWPGLGQLRLGRWRWGLVQALPPLALVLYLAFQVIPSPESFALRLFVPTFAVGIIGLIAAHAVWRVLSMVDAWWTSRTSPLRSDRVALLVLLLSVSVLGVHAFAGLYIQSYSTAGRPIFTGGQPQPAPAATDDPNTPDDEGDADVDDHTDSFLDDLLGDQLPTTVLGQVLDPGPGIPREGPLTVLFVGVDSAPGRDQELTDVLMVGAFDPHRNELALINVPRDTGHFPLYNGGGTYPDRVNSFLRYAKNNPDLYPEGAIRALTNQMAFLVGIPIHYYAVLDMAGFERIVDMVGGVTVEIDYSIADPLRRLYLEPGRHYLNGKDALSFVRSRHGPSNSDYRRAQRQQQVISAMTGRLRDPGVAIRLPQIAAEASRMARTNIPVESLEQFLDVLEGIDDATPTRVVLQPRKYAQRIPPEETGGRFMTELKMDAVEALSIELFGDFSLYASPSQDDQPPADLAPPALP